MPVRAQYQIEGRSARVIGASIEDGVARGDLAAGTVLPSVRTLAAQLRVSPATVAAAYRDLRTRGVVISEPRRGVRIAQRPPLPVRPSDPVPAGLVDVASGSPDPALLPPLPRSVGVTSAGHARLYDAAVDLPELLDRARADLDRDGIDATHVGVTSGGMDAVERVLAVHLRPGDRIAVEDPGYPSVLDLARVMGLEPVGIALDDRGMLPAALAAALEGGARAVVVTPRAQNPTGAAFDAERATKLRDVLDRHADVLVVEDDHAGAVAGASYRTLTGGRRRWAVVRTVSKTLGPDLRTAVLAADATTAARAGGRQRLGPGWVSHVLQRLVVAIWDDPETRARLERAAAAYRERREAMVAALDHRGIRATGRSGLNVWVPVPEEVPVVRGMAGAGWAVQAGETYRLASPPGIRITTAALPVTDADRLAADLAAILDGSARTRRA